jgi:hypothetical protein
MQRTALALLCVTVWVAWSSASLLPAQAGGRGKAPDAETHKAWMNDAADSQEDIREALAARDGKKVHDAALKIEGFMAQTESYWAAKKAADIVKLAQNSRALATEVASKSTANQWAQVQTAFDKLSATCNACHDLHPEKR